ncbi:MAG: AAA family ATPase, partial [Candidatus Dormibacteria bacterium]
CAEPVAQAERLVHALEVERAEVAVAVARAQDEHSAADADLVSCEARVAELAEAVRGSDDDEGPEPDATAALRAEREIVRLERRVGALGPVNGLAPEHHAQLEGRVERLRDDRDDLGGAADDIRALAAELGVEIERRFEAVFGAVSFHFHGLFEELFPGGRATLRLHDEPAAAADEEAAHPVRKALPGVEILAQPPGKRLQPLTLFSGGERALTALAVILALQHVNPSPFYLFDEVDAPLDDANVQRFTRLLRRLAERQQFVVVTHNHATMAAADSIYGVTIGADGVSSLLSVRFDPQTARIEPLSQPVAAAV